MPHHLLQVGFRPGRATLATLFHTENDLSVVVRGDDCVFEGQQSALSSRVSLSLFVSLRLTLSVSDCVCLCLFLLVSLSPSGACAVYWSCFGDYFVYEVASFPLFFSLCSFACWCVGGALVGLSRYQLALLSRGCHSVSHWSTSARHMRRVWLACTTARNSS